MDMFKHEIVFIDEKKKVFLPVSYTMMIKEQKKQTMVYVVWLPPTLQSH